MAINSDGDKKVDSDFSAITLHTWHSFEIKQWHEESDNKVGGCTVERLSLETWN